MTNARLVASRQGYLAHGMIHVCNADENCALPPLWTERHLNQGFAWLDNHVGFSALERDGAIKVRVWIADSAILRQDTVRARSIGTLLPDDGRIQVSYAWDEPESPPSYPIPKGEYALTFAIGYDPSLESDCDREVGWRGVWRDLTFVPDATALPTILFADAGLAPEYPLLLEFE